MNVNFYVKTEHNGLVKSKTGQAEEARVDSVKVWVLKDKEKESSSPCQIEGCSPWVSMSFGYLCVEFVNETETV